MTRTLSTTTKNRVDRARRWYAQEANLELERVGLDQYVLRFNGGMLYTRRALTLDEIEADITSSKALA